MLDDAGANFATSHFTMSANEGELCCLGDLGSLTGEGEALALGLRGGGVFDLEGALGDAGAAGARPTPLVPCELGLALRHAWHSRRKA